MISVAIAGKIVKKVDGRIMMVGGFLLIAWAGFLFGRINLEIAPFDVVLPNIVLGSAIGFVFVPLTTIAMGMLPNEKMGTATGIYNLMRNIGGSIGIAVITTILARSSQTYQAAMVSHLTPYDRHFQQSLDRLHGFFLAQSDPVTATQMALGTIYQSLLDQSMLLAYMINFRLLEIIAAPSAFLLCSCSERWRKKKSAKALPAIRLLGQNSLPSCFRSFVYSPISSPVRFDLSVSIQENLKDI